MLLGSLACKMPCSNSCQKLTLEFVLEYLTLPGLTLEKVAALTKTGRGVVLFLNKSQKRYVSFTSSLAVMWQV